MIVIGAGPAGLATAAVARQLGVRPTILDSGTSIGQSWARRYDSLQLHTARWLSGLPGRPIPRRYGRWVTRDDLVEYLQAYADQFSLEPEFGVTATRVVRDGDAWLVQTDRGERTTDRVAVATGLGRVPYVPDWPGRESFTGDLVHSWQYRNPAPYVGRDVLVVGTGNSGTEIASDLAAGGAARVRIAVRTPPAIVRRTTAGLPSQVVGLATGKLPASLMDPMSGLLRRLSVQDLTPYGLPAPANAYSQFLRSGTVPIIDHGFVADVRSGAVTVVGAVERLDTESVGLADGSTVSPDVVIAATGYRPGLDDLVGHLGVLDSRGLPLVSGGATLPGARRLHFVGIEETLAGILHEIGRQAESLAKTLA